MRRVLLDKVLQELDGQVIQLGSLVEYALARALEALETRDQDVAGAVVVADTTIDDLHLTIEEHALRILMLQQPLGGRDLRYLTAAPPIAIDLERIGDEAEEIAQDVLRMMPLSTSPLRRTPAGDNLTGDQFTEASILQKMLDVGKQVRSLLERTMKAFADRDAGMARLIWDEEKVMERRHYLVHRDLMTMLESSYAMPALEHDPSMVQRMTYLLWIAHTLKRVADHCTNICERVVFIVEGETEMHPIWEE
jgi:phosphate transport system protein